MPAAEVLHWVRRASRSVLDLRPRRALLYVPGSSERKIEKAAGLGADVVVLDCEDAVAENRKEVARTAVAHALEHVHFGRSERAVRINELESTHADEDLRAVLSGSVLPDALVVPKVHSVDHVLWLFDRVSRIMGIRLQGVDPPALITMCESGLGLLNLRQVIEECLERPHLLRLEACIFGADDFMASLGQQRQPGTQDTLFARQSMVLTARAFGIQPIDQVWIDYKDPHGLADEAEQGRHLGFAGKQVIHPSQIEPVHQAFSVDQREVTNAQDLVFAFEEHQKLGVGAFDFRGKMVDMPSYLQAKSLVRLAERQG